MGRFKIPVGVALFIGIWLLALCVPTVREIPKTFAFYEVFNQQDYFNAHISRAFVRRYPDDPTAALWAAEDDWRGYGADLNAETFVQGGDKTALKKVAARFPDDLQVRALQLRTASEGLSDLKSVRKQNDAALRARSIEAAQIARASAPLEPDNAFWPWMEAGFEFAASRDEAALRAFERVGKCARYDDYAIATFKARAEFWGRVESPSWEQKVALWASTLFPNLSLMRATAVSVGERSAQMRRAGQTKRAFALQADVLKAAQLLHQNPDVMISALVAEDIANASLEEFTGIARPKENFDVPNFERHARELAGAFADLARENGQDALAGSADWMREPSVRGQLRYEETVFEIVGMRAPWGILALVEPIALQALGLVIMAGALLWLAGALLKFEGRAPTRGQTAMCANFSFWLLLGGLAAIVFAMRVQFGFLLDFGNSKTVPLTFAFAVAALLCWLLPVWFIGLKTDRRLARYRPENSRPLTPDWNRARLLSWLVFGVALILTLTNGRGLWDGTWFALSNSALVADVAALVALTLEFARWQRGGWRFKLERRAAPSSPALASDSRLWHLAPYGIWLLCGVLLAPVAMNFVIGIPFSQNLTPILLAAFAALGALVSSWRLSRDHFKWQLARRSMGALLLAWSAVFLLLALAAWPLRAELNRNLERRIEIGEVAWVREQIAKNR